MFESRLYKQLEDGRCSLTFLTEKDIGLVCRIIRRFKTEIICTNIRSALSAARAGVPVLVGYDIKNDIDLDSVISKIRARKVLSDEEHFTVKAILSTKSKYIFPLQIFKSIIVPAKRCRALYVRVEE